MPPFQSWRIGSKLLTFVLVVVIAVTGLAAYTVHERNVEKIHEKLAKRAQAISHQLMLDRYYYATVIVPRLLSLGATVGADYQQVHGRFPLPATVVREISEWTATDREDYTISLISPWPINRAKGVADQFQKDAFAFFEKYPAKPFFRIDTVQGRAVFRYMTADRAVAQSCVDCHNAHPLSPRHDYKLNDVMGGLETVIAVEQYLAEDRQDLRATVISGIGFCLLLMGGIAWGIRLTVTRPLASLAARFETRLKIRNRLTHRDLLSRPGNEVAHFKELFERILSVITTQHAQLQRHAAEVEVANVKLHQAVEERTQVVERYARALRETAEQFRSVLNHVAEAIIFVDHAGLIQWVNPRAEALMGRPAHEVTGHALATFLSPDSALHYEASLAARSRRDLDDLDQLELEVVTASGATVWLDTRMVCVKESDQVVGWILVSLERAASLGGRIR